MICNYCRKTVEDLYQSNDDLCLDCHRKLMPITLSDEVGASYGQIKRLVSEFNKKNRRIAKLENENAKLKAALATK